MQETKPPAPPRRARLVVPSRSDLLLRNFTELIGGPMGSRSAPGLVSPGVFTVERVLIILTVLAALAGILIKGYCRANGWESPSQFYSTCYSDFPELFRNRGLGVGARVPTVKAYRSASKSPAGRRDRTVVLSLLPACAIVAEAGYSPSFTWRRHGTAG